MGAIILNADGFRGGHRLSAVYLSPQWGHSKADNRICTRANVAMDYIPRKPHTWEKKQ